MKTKYTYLIVGVIAVTVRLILNYHTKIIPGIGGGYYPVQIRGIIDGGHLPIHDMPLLFYLNAFFVKIIHFLCPNIETDNLILNVVKIFDSFTLPLILIPLYLINKHLLETKLPVKFELALIGFVTLSYSPLLLTSDALKNAFALSLMMCFVYYYLTFFKHRKLKPLILSIILLLITGFTHFGVFFICVCFSIFGLFVFYKRKALIPALIVFIGGLLLVGIFDIERAKRMLFFWKNAVGLLPMSPRLSDYPQGIISYLFSFLLIGVTIGILRSKDKRLLDFYGKALFIFLLFLTILSFPFVTFNVGWRLSLMHFVPQTVILVMIYPHLKQSFKSSFFYVIILLVAGSLIYHSINPKPSSITDEAYDDMKEMGKVIQKPEETIIFTTHDLEWWIVWELKTKIATAYNIAIDEDMRAKYSDILILIQKKGRNKIYPGKINPMREPEVPENGEKIYESEYFDLYRFIKE